MAQLMSLGLFVFEMATLPFQELSRRSDYRHAWTNRLGARPAGQFLGEGKDDFSLTGCIVPGIGNLSSIEQLRELASTGDALPLVAGTGQVLGSFVIELIDERGGKFFEDGVPRQTDFTIGLGRAA